MNALSWCCKNSKNLLHQRLLNLLDLPHVDEAALPTPTDFEFWKLISDRYAKDQDPRTSEVAMLAVQVAQTTDNATCLGLAHWMAGNVYFWQDLPEFALEHFETAEAAFLQHGETLQIARMAGSKASALIDLGKFEAALASITQWLAVLAASSDELDQQRLASLHNLRGVASDLSGRLTEALEGYQRKLEWWQSRADVANASIEAEIQVARSRINIGVVQTRLGQYAEAEAAFTQAQTALHSHTHSAAVLRDLARVDMNLAWLAMTRGSATPVVRAAFVQARASAQQQAVPLSPDLALLTLFEAEWLLHIGEGAAVDVNALLALRDHCTQAGLVYEVARAELALGECASRRDESETARHHFGQVLAAPIAREDADFPYLAHLGLARVCQSLGQLDTAITHFQSALQAVEGVRQRIRQDDFRAGYFEDKLAAYRGLTRALLHTQYFEKAFVAIEQTKGRTLTEALHTETDTPEPLGVSALAQQLPADTLAIQYAIVGDEVMALLVDKAGLVGKPVPLGSLPALDELRRGLNRITSVGQLPLATADAFAAQHIRAAQVVLQRWHTQFLAPLQPAFASTASCSSAPMVCSTCCHFPACLMQLPYNIYANRTILRSRPALAFGRTFSRACARCSRRMWPWVVRRRGGCAMRPAKPSKLRHCFRKGRRQRQCKC